MKIALMKHAKMRRAAGAALVLVFCAAARTEAADLMFELGFEDGLKPGGNLTGLVITERGGGLAESDHGKAWQFDGKSALEISVPTRETLSFAAGDQFTVQTRVRLEQAKTTGALISKGSGGSYRLSVGPDRTLGFSYYAQGGWRAYTGKDYPLPLGEWSEVAVQYDGSDRILTLLVDGKLAGKFPIEAQVQSRDAAPLFIGGTVNPESGEAKGLMAVMDDVRIYKGLKYPLAGNAEVGSVIYAPNSASP